ncbi:MAG: hypothetical protein R3E79_61070 [Caldilineaceae bacterium]
MTTQFTDRELNDRTREYRQILRNLQESQDSNERLKAFNWYCEHLLPGEMTRIKSANNQDRVKRDPNKVLTLVLLVGYSFEPLLQSICYYKPDHLILILNKQYGATPGNLFGRQIERHFIPKLIETGLLDRSPTLGTKTAGYFDEVKAEPSEVFRQLRQALVGQTGQVIIDITGSKKSMVTGAFFYAAFADTAISYVEFSDENYSWVLSQPAGYLSHIQRLSNPYETFALREWARVRTLYEQYRFKEALALIDEGSTIQRAMASIQGEEQSSLDIARNRLIQALKCYQHWDAGDLNTAQQVASKKSEQNSESKSIQFILPTVVEKFGGHWFGVNGVQLDGGPANLYDDNEELRSYIYDELHRVYRLICYAQDFSGAYLRAAGANEVLMLARLIRAVPQTERVNVLRILYEDDPFILTSRIYSVLASGNFSLQDVESVRRGESYKLPNLRCVTTSMCKWWQNTQFVDIVNQRPKVYGSQRFLDIRNKLAHTHASINEDLARAGYNFVRANFENFLDPAGNVQLSPDSTQTVLPGQPHRTAWSYSR